VYVYFSGISSGIFFEKKTIHQSIRPKNVRSSRQKLFEKKTTREKRSIGRLFIRTLDRGLKKFFFRLFRRRLLLSPKVFAAAISFHYYSFPSG